MTDATPWRVLIAEDDCRLATALDERVAGYKHFVEVRRCETAGDAIRELTTWQPDALILDLMMPYGEGARHLKGDDSIEVETGIRLLQEIRSGHLGETVDPTLWVAVITARSAIGVLRAIEKLIGEHGLVLQKPFEHTLLEHTLAHLFGLPSRVSEMLVPPTFRPPPPLAERKGRK